MLQETFVIIMQREASQSEASTDVPHTVLVFPSSLRGCQNCHPKGSQVLSWGILFQIIIVIPNIETLHSTI